LLEHLERWRFDPVHRHDLHASADWTISGGDRSPLAGQVIAWTAKVSGSAAVGIDFNPNYAPAPPAARLIN
jgi:hypothetical protein